MANNCYFLLKAVAKRKESLERLISIMRYEDPEGLFMYRVRELSVDKPLTKAGGFWTAEFSGDVAWSDYYWFHDYYAEQDAFSKAIGRLAEAIHSSPEDQQLRANIRTFKQLCPMLDLGVESWTEELGDEFQGHTICNADGKLLVDETRPYSTGDHGKPEPGYEGFEDLWGDFAPPEVIYGEAGHNKEGAK